MQVLEPGDMNDRFEKGNDVNLRFLRYDLKALVAGSNPSPVGNTNPSDYITIRFGETTLSSTTQYGTGIQYPMYFLGMNAGSICSSGPKPDLLPKPRP